jgi:DNA-directed RNA polymerase specialized sigma subunit
MTQALCDWAMAFARRETNRNVIPVDEADSIALVGLAKAWNRFDPDQGTPFYVWASIYIRGEIRMWLRTEKKQRQIKAALRRQGASLGYYPLQTIDDETSRQQILAYARPLLDDVNFAMLEMFSEGVRPIEIMHAMRMSRTQLSYRREYIRQTLRPLAEAIGAAVQSYLTEEMAA